MIHNNKRNSKVTLSKELDSLCRITKHDVAPSPSSPPLPAPIPTPLPVSREKPPKMKLLKRDLFGGAVQINVPALWRDVSAVRQVPDHQEVFQDITTVSDGTGGSRTGNVAEEGGTDGILIVEILERQDHISDATAAKFFFDDLAEANGTTETSIDYEKIWLREEGKDEDGLGRHVSDTNVGSTSGMDVHLVPEFKAHATACSCIGSQRIDNIGLHDTLKRGHVDDTIKDAANGTQKGDGDGHGAGGSTKEKPSRIQVELCAVRLEEVQTDLLVTLTMPMTDCQQQKHAEEHSELFRDILSCFVVKDWSLFG